MSDLDQRRDGTDSESDQVVCPGVEECTVLHVDMDAFFAAVEVLDDPELAGKPLIVGGSGTRGVVASCTYEARAYGIRSAMPSVEARRRCPEAIFIPGRYWRYAEMSEQFHAILKDFTPFVEGIGLDEAFLDVRGAIRLLGAPPVIASSIRQRVAEQLKMNCSVGVARTKMLAKLGSRAAKPKAATSGTIVGSGVFVIEPCQEIPFLHPLPVRAIWGVGPATAKRLEGLGIGTVGALVDVPLETLCNVLGRANGRHLAALARGEDETTVKSTRVAKSISHEETFARDVSSRDELHRHVLRMSDAVGARLVEAKLWGRTVNIKVRYGDRQTITRSHTSLDPIRSGHTISSIAVALMDEVDLPQGVRLIGVAVSQLEGAGKPNPRQLSFASFDSLAGSPLSTDSSRSVVTAITIQNARAEPTAQPKVDEEAWQHIQESISQIRARYGQGSVGPAALVGPGGLEAKKRGDTHWGPEASVEEKT